MKASYPTRLSLPVTASRLMSAIASSPMHSGRACAPLFENFRRVEASVATIGLIGLRPVRRHPAGPAKLPELREPPRFDRAGRKRQLDFPFELVANVEEHQIGQRFAAPAGRQIGDVLGHRFHEQANTELVLNTVNARTKQN